jgi:hypothetical protein
VNHGRKKKVSVPWFSGRSMAPKNPIIKVAGRMVDGNSGVSTGFGHYAFYLWCEDKS